MTLALAATLVGLAFFLVIIALAAAGQASLFHVNRARIRSLSDQGAGRARAVLRVLDEPVSSFGTLTALYMLSLAAAAGMTILAAADLLAVGTGAALAVVFGALIVALLLQVLARAVAIARPEATAMRIFRPLSFVGWLLAPLVLPLRALEHRLLRMLGVTRPNDPHWAEEELRLLMESSEERGMLEQEERQMIHGIFELSEVTARELMVPRIDVVSVPDSALVGEVLDRIVETGHSRLPIYEGNIDNITGVVYAKDILRHLKQGQLDDPARPLAREAYFVPEAKKVDEILQELQRRRVHIAIVVDEYGGTAGLLTIEDLLEEIVGDIQDEYDQAEETRVDRISEREAIVDARTTIREVNDLLSLNLPDDESDTLGGLVYDRLGKVPAANDEIRVDGCLIQVMSTEGRRIKKVRLLVGEPERSDEAP